MSIIKTQAVIFRDNFRVNHYYEVLRKQQSLGLRLKKLFSNEDIIEEYFALYYRTDFKFKKHGLMEEWVDSADRDPEYEKKRQKELEMLYYN